MPFPLNIMIWGLLKLIYVALITDSLLSLENLFPDIKTFGPIQSS